MSDKFEKYLKMEKWYHGTTLDGWYKICKDGVQCKYNKGHELDFGYGFYLMPDVKKAERFITKVLEYKIKDISGIPIKIDKNKITPVIIEFDFCPCNWYNSKKYNFKILNKYNDEFSKFVFYNRNNNCNGENQHNYDCIFGVMSDSTPIILLQQYRNDEITKEDVIEGLKKPTSVKQLSIHNQEICDIIKPERAYLIDSGKELDVNDYCNRKK